MSRFILSILILVSFTFVSFSSAQTTVPDFQAVIKQLQEQIKLLNQQIAELQSSLKETQKEVEIVKAELKITKSLRKGESGEEVRQLQEFLKQFPDIYPEGIVSGFFGSLTETAVKRFQEKHGIESIGIVGPKTIQKLNEFSVSATPTIPAVPAIPGVSLAIPAIPASLSLPFQPASSSQPIVIPATPATPAVPVIPGSSTAVPAIPATSAQPSSSTSTPTPTVTTSPFFSPTPTPTPTPTPAPTPTTTATAPAAPSNFTATVSSGTSSGVNITLTWTDNANNETGFYLQSTNPYGGEDNAYLSANQQSYNGYANMPPGNYSFTIRAYISDNGFYYGNKVFSAPAFVSITALTPTPTPTPTSSPLIFKEAPHISLSTAEGAASETVTISWMTSQSCSATIYYGLTSGYGSTINTAFNDFVYTYIFNLQQNTNYHYKVVCTTSDGKTLDSGDRTFMTGAASVSTPTSTSTPAPAPTSSISFSPLDQASATANILNALKSILQVLSNLLSR